MGLLTDRFHGRFVFAALLCFAALPVFAVPLAGSYAQLLAIAFFLGMAGSSFAVGVGFVSPWFGREKQGSALGVYGLGNAGQSAAVFLGPVLAAAIGWQNVFRGAAALLVVWAIAFAVFARNADVAVRPKSIGAMLSVLGREPLAWVLSAFYFLSFGGFVAFSIYLPSLLRDEFHLLPADAGFRTAGFVVLATAMRPAGGFLSDKIGGARVLSIAFLGIVPFAGVLAWPSILPFTVGALGCSALLGIANGAVFKLVPQYFPAETGTVTGLVGAMGGLGGFFPPLLLGVAKDRLGVIWPGFVLLAATALVLWIVNGRVFLPHEAAVSLPKTRWSEQLRAGAWATLWTGFLIAAIVVGSRNLRNFDSVARDLHFRGYFRHVGRGLSLQRLAGEAAHARLLGSRLATVPACGTISQPRAHRRKSRPRTSLPSASSAAVPALRWWMHQCLFWGCLLGVAITFPLVFGWISFGSRPDNQMIYVTYLFGFPAGQFPTRHICIAQSLFHGLDIAAVLVLAGIGLSFWRRMRDQRRAGSAVLRDGFLSADRSVRDFDHGPGFDRFASLAARRVLQLSRHPARHHGHRGAALSALWKVLPHFSAARAARRQTVSARPAMRAKAPCADAAGSGSHRRCTSKTCA